MQIFFRQINLELSSLAKVDFAEFLRKNGGSKNSVISTQCAHISVKHFVKATFLQSKKSSNDLFHGTFFN